MKHANFPGEALQARREELGLTLKEVHTQIRVPLEYIVAIEAGNYAGLPAPTYTHGFIVSYCELLEIAPGPYLHRYRMYMDRIAEPAAEPAARRERPAFQFTLPLPAQRPAWVSDALTWGAICGIVLLGWVAYSVVLKPAPLEDTRVNAGTIEIEAPDYHFLDDEL